MKSCLIALACIALLDTHFLFPACAEELGGIPVSSVRVANEFSSPQAVFKSFREAGKNGDWRRCFHCLTPDKQRRTLFELFLECAESGSGETRQIMAAHIGDPDKFRDEYDNQYKAKHGVDASLPADNAD